MLPWPSQSYFNLSRYQYNVSSWKPNAMSVFVPLLTPNFTNWSLLPYDDAQNSSLNNFVAGKNKQDSWGLWNYNISMDHSCFTKTNNSVMQSYDIEEALSLARQFCNGTIRDWIVGANGPDGIHMANDFTMLVNNGIGGRRSHFVKSVPLAGSNSSTQLTFAFGMSTSAIADRPITAFFEGLTPEKNTENCIKRYTEMIKNVSLMSSPGNSH